MKRLLLSTFLILNIFAQKVLIITHNYNRPDFVELQHKTFKNFLNDTYEFVVFNDARDENLMHQINAVCSDYGIKCIRIPQEIHTRPYLPRNPGDPLHRSNIRHANCVQYSMDVLGFDFDGIVLILDSDMFLIRPFSISEYMAEKDIAAFIKRAPNNVYCLCPAFCILNMDNLPGKKTLNFNCGTVNGSPVDSGGWTHHYLAQHPALRVTSASVLYSHQLLLSDSHINQPANTSVSNEVKTTIYENLGFNSKEIAFLLKKPDAFEFYLNNLFLHYRDGSNSTQQSQKYLDNKLQLFNEFIASILQ